MPGRPPHMPEAQAHVPGALAHVLAAQAAGVAAAVTAGSGRIVSGSPSTNARVSPTTSLALTSAAVAALNLDHRRVRVAGVPGFSHPRHRDGATRNQQPERAIPDVVRWALSYAKTDRNFDLCHGLMRTASARQDVSIVCRPQSPAISGCMALLFRQFPTQRSREFLAQEGMN